LLAILPNVLKLLILFEQENPWWPFTCDSQPKTYAKAMGRVRRKGSTNWNLRITGSFLAMSLALTNLKT